MKLTTIPVLILGLALTPSTTADSFSISKCICASDTRIGYHAAFQIKGTTSGFGDNAGRYNRSGDSIRDDISHPHDEGWLCAKETLDACKRIPDISQYYSLDDMTPRYPSSKLFHAQWQGHLQRKGYFDASDGETKVMPRGHHVALGKFGECDERCKNLWPGDSSTTSLCEVTNLNPSSAHYGQRVQAGNTPYADDADRCWSYQTAEWEWENLPKYENLDDIRGR